MLLNHFFYTYYQKKKEKKKWKCRLALFPCLFPRHRRRRHISPVTVVPVGQAWPAEPGGVRGNTVPACGCCCRQPVAVLPGPLSQAPSHAARCLTIREKANRGSSPFKEISLIH